MPTALADPPAGPTAQQSPVPAGAPSPPEQAAPAEQQAPARQCANCSAPLAAGQDWCLQCGTGAPDSLRSRTPTWRSAAVILTTLAILVAGAAGAAYAALSKGGGKAAPAVATVAQVSVPAATPAPTTTPLPPTATTPTPTIGVPTTIKPSTPPKIPLSAPTHAPPIPAVTPGPEAGGTTPTAKQKAPSPSTPVGEANNAEALLLDTNAAATYNPYNYAASNFGDPSLAIDGDSSTGWTAVVEPSVAPKMAEGLVIDLNTPRKLAAVGLSTTTPGMTVQVYGADGEAPPTSITDPAWVALTPAMQAKKKHARIKLGGSTPAAKAAAKQAHRFIVLWISQAPASAVGTPTAPGHVSVNELQLFPLKKK